MFIGVRQTRIRSRLRAMLHLHTSRYQPKLVIDARPMTMFYLKYCDGVRIRMGHYGNLRILRYTCARQRDTELETSSLLIN